MVSNFIQKNVIILRILLILTMVLYYMSATLNAKDVNYLLKNQIEFKQEATIHSNEVSFWRSFDLVGMKKVKKVVIDAGHGGHDSGAVGKNVQEKELTLKMAIQVGELIRIKYPDVEVLLTRTTDVFIPLFRRIQYANEQNADLFISIHCNYISNAKTKGTETFVMGLHRADDNLDVAKRENASILLEQNYESNYDGFDPNSPEGHIMMSMYQNAYLDKSIEFAADVEAEFGGLNISKSRGVKQAGFAVLRRASMPAVLVEAGFLSNAEEEAFLMSEDGQLAICRSIVKAFDKFYESNLSNTYHVDNKTQVLNGGEITSVNPTKNLQKAEKSRANTNKKLADSKAIGNTNITVYQVQIAAIKTETADMNTTELRKIGELFIRKQGDVNKYLVGRFESKEEATIAREKLKKIGYKGAFIVIAMD